MCLFNTKHAGLKNSADDVLKYVFLFFSQKIDWHFMQIVSAMNYLSIFDEKKGKTIINLSSAEFAQRMVKIKIPQLPNPHLTIYSLSYSHELYRKTKIMTVIYQQLEERNIKE